MTAMQKERLLHSDKGDAADQETASRLSHSRVEVLAYSLVFFLAMIFHELALEACMKAFSSLDAVAGAVTLAQFGFCVALPVVVTKGRALERFPTNRKSFLPYIGLSIVVFGATALASQAVKYVTYPTKVIFKSAKLIPTMMVATVLQGTAYHTIEYFSALLLCIGAAGYSLDSGNGSHSANQWQGILLLLISIVCDALVPNLQQRLLSANNKLLPAQTDGTGNLSAGQLMVNVNAIGFVGLLGSMLLAGQLTPILAASNPLLLFYLFMIGMGLSTAVFAYTKLIQSSGSVVAVAVSTLRKVATVVLSYVFFPKPLTPTHIFSGCLVLTGMFLSTHSKHSTRRNN